MKNNLEIRRAAEKDITRIMDMLLQVCMVHHDKRPDIFKGPATKYSREELLSLLSDDKRPIFVCCDGDGFVIGYAFCILQQHINDLLLTDIRTLYIDDLCVDENLRGKGIGKALYDYVLEYAESINCYNLTLNVWTSNTSAMKFYENIGLLPQKIGMEKILH